MLENLVVCNLEASFIGYFCINEHGLVVCSYVNNQILIHLEDGIIEFFGDYVYSVENELLFIDKSNGFLYRFMGREMHQLDSKQKGSLFGDKYISLYDDYIGISNFPFFTITATYSIQSLGSYVDYNHQPTAYKVSKFIGISGHQLLAVLNDRFILSLNVQTGELIKLVDVCAALELNPVSFGNMRPADVYLCPNRNQLLWLSFHYYIQIDTNTFEPRLVKHYALGDKSTWWNIKHSTLSDQFMVFNADYGDKRISPDHLGIANVDTGEVVWSERIVNKGFLVNNPQSDGQKLYQLDNNGNLYVYGNVE